MIFNSRSSLCSHFRCLVWDCSVFLNFVNYNLAPFLLPLFLNLNLIVVLKRLYWRNNSRLLPENCFNLAWIDRCRTRRTIQTWQRLLFFKFTWVIYWCSAAKVYIVRWHFSIFGWRRHWEFHFALNINLVLFTWQLNRFRVSWRKCRQSAQINWWDLHDLLWSCVH